MPFLKTALSCVQLLHVWRVYNMPLSIFGFLDKGFSLIVQTYWKFLIITTAAFHEMFFSNPIYKIPIQIIWYCKIEFCKIISTRNLLSISTCMSLVTIIDVEMWSLNILRKNFDLNPTNVCPSRHCGLER